MIALLISLLISSPNGVLEDLYLSQFPLQNNQPHILYILHQHLNQNSQILCQLLNDVSQIQTIKPVAIRLLKLIVEQFSNYNFQDCKKLNQGAFGQIYQAQIDKQKYIIKQWNFPRDIYDRNVLYDIFNEISVMQKFRFHDQITQLYEFGQKREMYFITMKKYRISLKEWRTKQNDLNYDENLQIYLKIFYDILNIVKLLHQNLITHYDLKSDNIFLDYDKNDPNIKVTLADFGECKIQTCPQDQFQIHNKGTEYIKAPEMLLLGLKKDTPDRRKKIGTTKSCDIWALGCLLYEILTGEFLFYNNDWIQFYAAVTQGEILSQQNIQKLKNNQYICDFLKFVLIRDANYRPNIDNLIDRFQHVIGIITNNNLISYQIQYENNILYYVKQIKKIKNQDFDQNGLMNCYLDLFKITNDIFICSEKYYNQEQNILEQLCFQFIIANQDIKINKQKIQILLINNQQLIYFINRLWNLMPTLCDFIRNAIFQKGKILLIYNKESLYIFNLLLATLSILLNISGQAIIQLTNFSLMNQINLPLGFKMINFYQKINEQLINYPNFKCLCGINKLILKRKFNTKKNIKFKICKCLNDQQYNQCQTGGCQNYINFIKDRYNIIYNEIKWGIFQTSDFMYGPFSDAELNDEQIINMTLGMQKNTEIVKHNGEQNIQISQQNTIKIIEWAIYKCKYCQIWIYAQSLVDQKIMLIMNNQIKQQNLFKDYLTQNKSQDIQNININDFI